MRADEATANEHYAEHTEKPFFGELVSFITGGTLVAMVLEGTEAVKAARQLIGATNPVEAAPGSIRGDFALEVTFNMVPRGTERRGAGDRQGHPPHRPGRPDAPADDDPGDRRRGRG